MDQPRSMQNAGPPAQGAPTELPIPSPADAAAGGASDAAAAADASTAVVAAAGEASAADDRPIEPAASPLVWPPPDEDLDDWQVIALRAPERPLPSWLANRARTREAGAPRRDAAPVPALVPAPARIAEPYGGLGEDTVDLRAPTPRPALGREAPVGDGAGDGTGEGAGEGTAREGAAPAATSIASPARVRSLEDTATMEPGVPRVGPLGAGASLAPRVTGAPPAGSSPRQVRPGRTAAATGTDSLARRLAVIALVLLAVGQAAYIGARLLLTAASAAPPAVLVVDSMPSGAEVFIDGQRRGATPFRADLPAGTHLLELRKNGRVRALPLTLAAGVQASQYVELGAAPGRTARRDAGTAGASRTPRADLPEADTRAAERTGTAEPSAAGASPTSATGRIAVPSTAPPAAAPARPAPAPPGPARGWVTVDSALNLGVLRDGEFLGNSDEGRLPLPAGRQELDLVNSSVGYRATVPVQVTPGRETILPVELPQSTINISAIPSAIVWVDGRELGNAPVNRLALPVGAHEIRFRHPEFGERRVTVLVRVGVTAHASVDFTAESK